jgi:ribosome-associated toxin RatA of RatAB toxin-antitoxin module
LKFVDHYFVVSISRKHSTRTQFNDDINEYKESKKLCVCVSVCERNEERERVSMVFAVFIALKKTFYQFVSENENEKINSLLCCY